MDSNLTSNQPDSSADHSAAADNYDPHIVPAETAARKDREKDAYKHTPGELGQDSHPEAGDINTTDGYTVDKEGLLNNYPIEPEMYINEPGDLRDEQEQEKSDRAAEYQEVNQTDETGKLSDRGDNRGKGVGLV